MKSSGNNLISLTQPILRMICIDDALLGCAAISVGLWIIILSVLGAAADELRMWQFYFDLLFPAAISCAGIWKIKPTSRFGQYSLLIFVVVIAIYAARLLLFRYCGFDPVGSWHQPK